MTIFIANNSGDEPAVGTRFHNKMSVNMATDLKRNVWKTRKKLQIFAFIKYFGNVPDRDIDTRSKNNLLKNNSKTSVADLSFYYLSKTKVYSILTL